MLDEEVRIRRTADGEILRRVSNLNRKYEVNDFNGIQDGEWNYQIITGQIPVLVSAPHAVRQLRDGEMKERDGMTGGIAEYVGINGGRNVSCEFGEVDKLLNNWRGTGLDVRVDEQFVAAKSEAVSNYVHRATGANCLQLEISTMIRTTAEGLERFCDGFLRILNEITISGE